MNPLKNMLTRMLAMCNYGKVGKNFFVEQRELIDKNNLAMVKFSLVALTVMFSLLSVSALFVEPMGDFLICYLPAAITGCVAAVFSTKLSVRNHRLILLFYIFAVIILCVPLMAIGVFFQQNVQAVSFYFTVMIVPVLYLDKPRNSLILLTIQIGVFIGAVMLFKWENQKYMKLDILNAVCSFVTSAVFTVYIRNMHLSLIQMSINYQYKSEIDKLTGINNKASTEVLCNSYISTMPVDSQCAMLIIDVDNFKGINDNMGHSQGDVILSRVGSFLRSIFRDSDIVGRIGGDEFLVLMKGINNSVVAELKADEIVRKFCDIFPEAVNMKLTCSVGVSINKHGQKNYDEMFFEADKALYTSKNNGKSAFTVFSAKKIIVDENKPLMLIADDDAISRAVLENCFKDKFNIITADNGAKALSYMKMYPGRISIVLLDVVMPVMNGYDLLRILKKSSSLSKIPVVAISADKGNELMTLDMGAIDYIEKPINTSVARKRIDNVLARYK